MNRHEEDKPEAADADEPLDVLPAEETLEAIQGTPPRHRRPVPYDAENKAVTPRKPRRRPGLAVERSVVPCLVGGILAGVLLLAGLTTILWWLWPHASPPPTASLAVAGAGKTRSIEGWGTLTDPDGDCGVQLDQGKLVLTVPGTNHNLNPDLGVNAPRVLRPIKGDFEATVKVSGDFRPGMRATIPGYPFNGAGLVLWHDTRNFLRLERNIWWVPEIGQYACYPPLFEYYRDNRSQATNPRGVQGMFFQGRSTHLRLQRTGDRVTAAFSHDGDEWTTVKEIAVNFPETLFVGVAAVNSSDQPFVVEFVDFKVTGE